MSGLLTGAPVCVGKLHPLLVHLPIGGLVLLGLLEVLSGWKRWKSAAQNNLLIIVFVCGSGVASAASGWTLAGLGGYDQQLLKWHQSAGFILVGVCVIAAVLRSLQLITAYRVCLAVSIPFLIIAGHLGGSISHGRDFLTRSGSRSNIKKASLDQPVFSEVVAPILEQRCVSCHGPEKHKADLRLDSFEALLRGGQDGPVLKAGHAEESPLLKRMLLPLDEDGHMPPQGETQSTAQETELLEWWINAGAPTNRSIADLRPAPKIRSLLEFVSRKVE